MTIPCNVWIGYDPRELPAYVVARHSVQKWSRGYGIRTYGVVLSDLLAQGLYYRPTEVRDGRLWDVISDAPMATEFAVSRFLVPHLQRQIAGARKGWAVFMDCDMLVRAPLHELFDQLDDSMAVACVKHVHNPPEGLKMDNQAQLRYARKNWSSVMAFNCDHPENDGLDVRLVNTVPGRDLHRFCWLEDRFIQELDVKWNWLAGHSDPSVDPYIVHHTDGSPFMPGYEDAPYARAWRNELLEAVR